MAITTSSTLARLLICLSALPTITSGMRLFDMALNIWPFVVPSLLVILTALRQL